MLTVSILERNIDQSIIFPPLNPERPIVDHSKIFLCPKARRIREYHSSEGNQQSPALPALSTV
jgi:hypothetical protein